ncbi:hypothetical protein [Tateyamaria sp. syn59]|uniref:hypothetical protein n=1 Tax=Tateyamaria sp. syn59 TaxID=2576942 RepID=UPI0011BF8C98|nr:hypothetical protein [Tateyamaria sp. syn59]
MRGLLAALTLALTPGAAAAFCGDMYPVLQCQIGTKSVKVCVGQGQATYAFGPRGAEPELSLTRSLADVQATPWPGIGRSIWEDITFENKGTRYRVWVAVDRMAGELPGRGGVVVSQGDETLANLECQDGSVDLSIFAIADAMLEAGFCADYDSQLYSKAACAD